MASARGRVKPGDGRIISVEFAGGVDAISGRLRDGPVEVAFTGWLGLVAALDAAWRRHSGDLGAERTLRQGEKQ